MAKTVEAEKAEQPGGFLKCIFNRELGAGRGCCRVAEVGRLSANAKNAFNSFVRRVFANSRQKTTYFRVIPKLQQKRQFLPSFTWFLSSFTQFYQFYLVFTSFYQFLLVLPSFTQFLTSFTQFLTSFTQFLLVFTQFYLVFLPIFNL